MKKILAILTLVVMMVTLIAPVSMAAVKEEMELHSCVNGCIPVTTTTTSYTNKTTDTHTRIVKNSVNCRVCGAHITDTETRYPGEAHTFGAAVKQGHHATLDEHWYSETCTKCSYVRRFTKPCNTCY